MRSDTILDIRRVAQPLTGAAADCGALLDMVGNARFVLLGEATHGSHEFYQQRTHITRQLIERNGFTAVAVEADWPDAYRVNRWVRGVEHGSPVEALAEFKRFPAWMWRNADVVEFIGWLRRFNDALSPGARKIGFYGLDLYSLQSSMSAVIGYLDKIDPEASQRARRRYACFDHFGDDAQRYGYAAGVGTAESCEDEVVAQLRELQRRAADYATRDGRVAEDEFFYAEQNARIARNAEEYYRSMFRGRASSWNLRDRHMAESLDFLIDHLDARAGPTKVVIWEHNSHIGDARGTEMSERGELNVGQLVRERYGAQCRLIGFTTYTGSVTAASDWDAPADRKRVRPALDGSYEAILHDAGLPAFWIDLRDLQAKHALQQARLERAIGVIYRPETERLSHYFYARLPEQFDAVIHLDETSAVQPLERTAAWQAGEMPETFPSAL
jgi:erythromycin esterase-like protein